MSSASRPVPSSGCWSVWTGHGPALALVFLFLLPVIVILMLEMSIVSCVLYWVLLFHGLFLFFLVLYFYFGHAPALTLVFLFFLSVIVLLISEIRAVSSLHYFSGNFLLFHGPFFFLVLFF